MKKKIVAYVGRDIKTFEHHEAGTIIQLICPQCLEKIEFGGWWNTKTSCKCGISWDLGNITLVGEIETKTKK